jgi:hypothetical protein
MAEYYTIKCRDQTPKQYQTGGRYYLGVARRDGLPGIAADNFPSSTMA